MGFFFFNARLPFFPKCRCVSESKRETEVAGSSERKGGGDGAPLKWRLFAVRSTGTLPCRQSSTLLSPLLPPKRGLLSISHGHSINGRYLARSRAWAWASTWADLFTFLQYKSPHPVAPRIYPLSIYGTAISASAAASAFAFLLVLLFFLNFSALPPLFTINLS